MTQERHALRLDETVDQGRRIELARVAAQLEQEEMARAAEISVRSYQRTITGERKVRRGELLAWAELTGQDLGFLESASLQNGAPILSQSKPPVKRRGKAAA